MSAIRWPCRTLSLVVAGAACASNTAPKHWLPTPREAQSVAYGGWIELTYKGDPKQRHTDGELIAVSPDSVWVLGVTEGVVVPTAAVEKGKLTGYAAQKGPFTTWATVGALSTLSNGGFLLFTAPMWIVGGSLAVGGESRAPERNQPPLAWVDLAPFARFPQGMPDGIELKSLQPKKYTP